MSTNAKYLTPNVFVSYTRLFYQPKAYWENGYKFYLSATGTIQSPLFSTNTFFQSQLQARQSLNLSDNSRIFVRELGGFTAVDNFSDLAPTYRFYIGGLPTVRGLNYFSEGPANASGNVIGGQYLVTANINLEHHFFGDWSGSVFYDIGSAFNTPNRMTFFDSVGIGIGWRSPLGPLNLYLAHPINVPGQDFGFDVSIGKFI